jgi:hypothetical protein
MGNPFDIFDAVKTNPFDQFDAVAPSQYGSAVPSAKPTQPT